jgi:hypothetical protein
VTEMHASYGANHIGKKGLPDPDAAMWRILTEHPEYLGHMNKAHDALVAEANDDHGLRQAMLLSEAVRSFWRVSQKMRDPAGAKIKYHAHVAARDERERAATKKVAHAISAFISRIAEMTFGEVGKMAAKSKQLAKLAKMGKPFEIVGEKLTGQQITKIINTR